MSTTHSKFREVSELSLGDMDKIMKIVPHITLPDGRTLSIQSWEPTLTIGKIPVISLRAIVSLDKYEEQPSV